MGSKIEYLSVEGLRVDGRRPGEIRCLKVQLGLFDMADGSCYYEQGNTKVLAAVYGPRQVASRMTRPSATLVSTASAALVVHYTEATFSTGGWRKQQRNDRKAAEAGQAIRKAFEAVVMTHLYPNSQIEIFLQLLQNDWSTFPACINATTLALVDAGIPMRDYLVASTAGFIDGTALVDLCQIESEAGGPELPVAICARTQSVALLHMDSKIGLTLFDQVFDAALQGCNLIFKVVDAAVRQHATQLLETRGIGFNR
eukprot:RCo012642